MTEKQVKQRWVDIKKTITARPLLAYLTGIPYNEWNQYMSSFPSASEINRIYDNIRDDRTQKTKRIKDELQNIVGYREAKQFSKKIGVSDSTIREIIEEKKLVAGYSIINRLEVFINVINPTFELSIENPLSKEIIVKDEFEEIINDVRNISNSLLRESFELTDVAKNMKAKLDWHKEISHPAKGIDYTIERLKEVREKISLIYETYIENK
ncbi:hypothetical protein KO02_13500 [Sphingobacterium sp. ML3W]|uniref:hypothetical protein n=1 Tax=Sphingobacterium sp. ML3W TaxID=1538644 RepID=UPI0004F5E7E0|nr:hypothetical protein [Sphingobacterium sp. ML3W]AIM37588.1 hypothetical protein KO02_13500 [Sphingobacterium sp. ML3W]